MVCNTENVFLYVPNIIAYTRIILAFTGKDSNNYKNILIKGRIRSCGFLVFFTVAFLLFLAPAGPIS